MSSRRGLLPYFQWVVISYFHSRTSFKGKFIDDYLHELTILKSGPFRSVPEPYTVRCGLPLLLAHFVQEFNVNTSGRTRSARMAPPSGTTCAKLLHCSMLIPFCCPTATDPPYLRRGCVRTRTSSSTKHTAACTVVFCMQS